MEQSYFPILLLPPPFGGDCDPSFHYTWNPLYPRILCAKFYWNWPSDSWVEVLNVISLCGYYLPLIECMALKLNKIWIPFTQEYFVSCLVEIGPAVLKKIFKCCLYIFNLLLLSLLRKRARSIIWKKLIPLTQGCSVPSLLKSSDSMYFHYVAIISLWQRAWSVFWRNLNHHRNALCQVWWNLIRWFWRSSHGWTLGQTDKQTINNKCFAKHNWALSSDEQAHVN